MNGISIEDYKNEFYFTTQGDCLRETPSLTTEVDSINLELQCDNDYLMDVRSTYVLE